MKNLKSGDVGALEGNSYFVIDGIAYSAECQFAGPFNRVPDYVEDSDSPKIGKIDKNRHYWYPSSSEGKMVIGWTKREWSRVDIDVVEV